MKRAGTKAKRRQTGGYELTVEAQAAVEEYWRRSRMPKKSIVMRVMTWFALQPGPVKRVVLDDVDTEMAAAYASVLRKLADDAARAVDPHPVAEGADLDPDVVARIKLHASNDGISPSQLVKDWLDGRSGDRLRSRSAGSAEQESARTTGRETSGPPTAKPKSEPPAPIARR